LDEPSAPVDGFTMAFAQIVENDDLVSLIQKFPHRMTSDVSGSAGHHHSHKGSLTSS
jgi:hypothetical protein